MTPPVKAHQGVWEAEEGVDTEDLPADALRKHNAYTATGRIRKTVPEEKDQAEARIELPRARLRYPLIVVCDALAIPMEKARKRRSNFADEEWREEKESAVLSMDEIMTPVITRSAPTTRHKVKEICVE